MTCGANLRVTWEFSRGFSRRVTRRMSRQVTRGLTRGTTCRVPTRGAGQFLFCVLLLMLRRVLNRVMREALVTATSPVQMRAFTPGLVSPAFGSAGSAATTVAANAAARVAATELRVSNAPPASPSPVPLPQGRGNRRRDAKCGIANTEVNSPVSQPGGNGTRSGPNGDSPRRCAPRSGTVPIFRSCLEQPLHLPAGGVLDCELVVDKELAPDFYCRLPGVGSFILIFFEELRLDLGDRHLDLALL